MRWLATILGCVAFAAFAQDEPRAESPPDDEAASPVKVTWVAPDQLRKIFEKHLVPPKLQPGVRRGAALRPWERDIRRRVPEVAAAEGYFSATVEIAYDGEARDHATITVIPGPLTVVADFDIEFLGDLAENGDGREERRRQLREGWAMKAGAPFRSADWDGAKVRLEEALVERDYAAGSLTASRAEVDAEAATAHLKLTLDSGPRFTLGEVVIEGLEIYPDAVIKRVLDLQPGERYNHERLLELQRLIQSGPWFSSVVVEAERDPAKPLLVPVKILVTERPTKEVGVALGYGTDDGARGETTFRHRNIFGRGFDLQSSLRISQKQQFGYTDVYLPTGLFAAPRRGEVPFVDSVGILAEHKDVENLETSRFAAAGYRHFKLEKFELRLGVSYQIERDYPQGAEVEFKRALAPIAAITWRHVDNPYDPRRGGVLNVQVAAGSKSLGSGDDFLKAYGQYQYWVPLGANDQLLLRTELGRTFAVSRDHIPEDFLFRAGGARSNRGYAYESLGPTEGNAVVGGRYLATGTVEYVHWLNERWGGALFMDIGDASDSIKEWEPLKSYGAGVRFRTPAGPFGLDLAWAERDRKFRFAFSVTIAF